MSRREGKPLPQTFTLPLALSGQSPALGFPLRQDPNSPLPRKNPWHRWLRLWWVMIPGDTGHQQGCLHLSCSPWISSTNKRSLS